MSGIPYKEHPSREDLEGYVKMYKSTEDFAWSTDMFGPICLWLADREERRRRKESKEKD